MHALKEKLGMSGLHNLGLSEWNVQSHTHPPPTQYEAIPESLKNMLLVMSTQGIFDIVNSSQSDPSIHLSAKDAISQLLWQQTQERVEKFLPNLLCDLFPGLASSKKDTPTKEITMATVAMAVPSPAGSPIRSTSTSPLSTSPGEWAWGVCVCVCVCVCVWIAFCLQVTFS